MLASSPPVQVIGTASAEDQLLVAEVPSAADTRRQRERLLSHRAGHCRQLVEDCSTVSSIACSIGCRRTMALPARNGDVDARGRRRPSGTAGSQVKPAFQCQ